MKLEQATVLIADGSPIFRYGLSRRLAEEDSLEVVAEVGDGVSALAEMRRLSPSLALVDRHLPGVDGIAIAECAAAEQLSARILLLSAVIDSASVYNAMRAGAAGYLSKDSEFHQIEDALTSVAAGALALPAQSASSLAGEIRNRAMAGAQALSRREMRILQLFSRGVSIPRAAQELQISVNTVKTHVRSLYEKLDVSDRAAAVAVALRSGLIE